MHRKMKALCVVAAILAASPALAVSVTLEANGAQIEGVFGAEVGVGYAIGAAGFSVRPMVGAFVHKVDDARYIVARFSNGQTRCRDSRNGQFANDQLCDNSAVKAYARVEATYTIPLIAEVGVGARFSGDVVRPYGTVAFSIAPGFKAKLNGGPQYYAIGLKAAF